MDGSHALFDENDTESANRVESSRNSVQPEENDSAVRCAAVDRGHAGVRPRTSLFFCRHCRHHLQVALFTLLCGKQRPPPDFSHSLDPEATLTKSASRHSVTALARLEAGASGHFEYLEHAG